VTLGWRLVALAGLVAGLLASPLAPGASPATLAAALAAVGILAAARPSPVRRLETGVWLALVASVAAAIGLVGGAARLGSIDSDAFEGRAGSPATATGYVADTPRRSRGEVRVRIQTPDGRLQVEAPEPVEQLPVGSRIAARGTLAEPEPWRAGELRRHGIAMVLSAPQIELAGGQRGDLQGELDEIRSRAEAALGRGPREREAALARGFVLGQDDRIDPATVDEFKRSGLAHLLAVSGQNVMLLALLAWPLLALGAIPLRARLLCLLALIAIYVPVAGAGPSIQRAGVMGAAGIVTTLASRPSSRWYALLLAAAATLAVNPRASGDVGWQLSFAAVAGILLWAQPIRRLLGGDGAGVRRAVAEGAALTIAATVATAPLMAHHFERLSLAALPANLIALPAVAPAMWLGMLSAGAGQLAAVPVEPLNWLCSLCVAYIAQVAHWFSEPSWAAIELRLDDPLEVALAYLGLLAAMRLALAWFGRRRGFATARAGWRAAAAAVGAVAILVAASVGAPGAPPTDPAALRVVMLDVGQGDSILLDPPRADPVLVDGGPPGGELRERLREQGVEALAAVVLTHESSDHAGGIKEVLGAVPVRRLLYGRADAELLGAARAADTERTRVAEGSGFRSGELRLSVLWPPREVVAAPTDDPNARSLVMVAEWRHFSILLTADAEAEAVPIEPGPVDVLKVAHHGSADEGLEGLLERTVPRVALISVAEDNPYGHPTPQTLGELAEREVRVLRTDQRGSIPIEADAEGWRVAD
jgi:competence protein ComEC